MPDDGMHLRKRATVARVIDTIDWNAVAQRGASYWWRRHPAHAIGVLARPMLTRYAREQPGTLLAVAAAAGAVAVLVKPWRLLPATALVAALLKTSDVAELVTTLTKKREISTKGRTR